MVAAPLAEAIELWHLQGPNNKNKVVGDDLRADERLYVKISSDPDHGYRTQIDSCATQIESLQPRSKDSKDVDFRLTTKDSQIVNYIPASRDNGHKLK
jgi:hypothetical protein